MTATLRDTLGYTTAETTALYGEYTFGMTLFMLPPSFIYPLSVSLMPAVSAALTRRDRAAAGKAAGAAQSEEDYLARVEAALNEAMTLEGRTVSWKETNDEGRTLACAVELEPFGAFPRFVRTVYHLAIDEGAMEGEDLLFDAGYIGEL